MAATSVRFFNSGSWPYAQRSWIALEECGVKYETTIVDLQNKSPEFLASYAKANPIPNARAKVPLLQIGDDEFICESQVVTEYIAEVFSSSELLPKRPQDRVLIRTFYELCGSTFSYFPLLQAASKNEKFDEALETFRESLINANTFLVEKGSDDDSPFFLKEFSLVECYVAPFVQRSCTILPNFTGDDGIPLVDPLKLCDELDLPRLKKWIEAVLSRPSVVKTGNTKEETIQGTKNMLKRFAAMAASK